MSKKSPRTIRAHQRCFWPLASDPELAMSPLEMPNPTVATMLGTVPPSIVIDKSGFIVIVMLPKVDSKGTYSTIYRPIRHQIQNPLQNGAVGGYCVVFNSIFTSWVWLRWLCSLTIFTPWLRLRWLCSTLTLHFYDVSVAMVMFISSTIFTLWAIVSVYTRHSVCLPFLTKGGSG